MKKFTLTTYDADGNPMIENVRYSRDASEVAVKAELTADPEELGGEVVAYAIKPSDAEEEWYWNV